MLLGVLRRLEPGVECSSVWFRGLCSSGWRWGSKGVLGVLRNRFGVSGVEEKAKRTPKSKLIDPSKE